MCKQRAVYPPEQSSQATFMGRADDHDAGTFGRWESTVVEVVVVERHERTPKLTCETIVLCIPRPPELIVLEDEKDIPFQAQSHEADKAGRHIGVRVHARLRRKPLGVRTEFR